MIEWEEYKEESCIVVPVYKKNPIFFEQASLMQCVRVLGARHDIFLVAPYDLDLSAYTSLCPTYKFRIKRLAKGFFDGIKGYNQLCKRWEFYEMFSVYRYMLIYQLDCWVFADNLEYFMSLDYDYMGAPWLVIEDGKAKIGGCGNGGFSLRKVEKFKELCKNHVTAEDIEAEEPAEDVFFCQKCADHLKICPPEIGKEFSFEAAPQVFFKLNGEKLPMGCHKPYLFNFNDFWKDYIKF